MNIYIYVHIPCVEPCGNLNAVSLSMYVNVIANTCVPTYKHTLMMMIAFITFKSSLVPLLEGL